MAARHRDLVWHPPAAHAGPAEIALEWPAPATGRRRGRRPPDRGWVEVRGAESPREELLALLTLAAEVEHALLVQYLYAAASLDAAGTTSTQQLRQTFRGIALQEMAHLISVQNLLLAVGGPDHLHLGRDGVRSASVNNPLPFALEPVSELTLSEYALAEAPALEGIADPGLRDRLTGMKLRVKKQAGVEPHRVGAVYTQIYWLLQPGDAPRGPLQLDADPSQGRRPKWHLRAKDFTDPKIIAAYQAGALEWRGNNGPDLRILPVGAADTSRSGLADIALQNVYAIMEQGEGVAQGEDSHFHRFLAALDLLAQGALTVLPLPRTPYALPQPPTGAPAPTALKKPYTRLWANLFDGRYTMLRLDIRLTLATPNTNAGRATLVAWAFANMKPLFPQLLSQLASPALARVEPCGPTFGLLYEDLPAAPAEAWKLYQTLLGRERDLLAALDARPELAGDVDGQDLVDQLKDNSAARSKFVAQQLAGPA